MESLTNSPSNDTLISRCSERTSPNVLLAPNSLGIGPQTERGETRGAKPLPEETHGSQTPGEGGEHWGFKVSPTEGGPQGGEGPARLCGGSGNSGYSGLEQGAPRPIAKGTAGTASPAPTLRRREHRHHLVGESACRQLAGSSAERPPPKSEVRWNTCSRHLPAAPPRRTWVPAAPPGPETPRENAHGAGSARFRPHPSPGAAVWDGRGSQSLVRSQPCPSAA